MSLLREALSRVWFLPDAEISVEPSGAGEVLPVGRPFTVLSWNIQFCAGRSRWFFYDTGPDVHVSDAEVADTLRGVASLVRSTEPDIVLLQEVDRASRRTGFLDQHELLHEALELPCEASSPYFKVPFVPVPPKKPLGPVDMHLSVFSRFALGAGVRYALSALQEPVWRRAFNLRRALVHLPVQTTDGPFHLFHTHLSAFSRGDGTLDRQVATVLRTLNDTAGPALLAGDLNSLPPSVDPASLGMASVLYDGHNTPIQPLWDELDVLFPPILSDGRVPSRGHTYVPWGSNVADRTIDYAFGRQVRLLSAEALSEGARWSDHLPIRLQLEIT